MTRFPNGVVITPVAGVIHRPVLRRRRGFGPLMGLPAELVDVQLAFSRAAGKPKEYVQDRLGTCASKVAQWLKEKVANMAVHRLLVMV